MKLTAIVVGVLAAMTALTSCQSTSGERGHSGVESRTATIVSVDEERLSRLSKGINLSTAFMKGANPLRYDTAVNGSLLARLHAAGLTFCRLPLDPSVLFNAADPSRLLPAVKYVDRAVDTILAAGLAVVIDPIHTSSSDRWFEGQLATDPSFRGKVAQFWHAIAARYADRNPDYVFYEIMNEPHASAFAGVHPSWWPPVQEKLAQAIRSAAPRNTIIATGPEWGGIDGLLAIKPLRDPDVVYSFHFYEPFRFTHQGAAWAGPLQESLRDVPYPSSPQLVQKAVAEAADAQARKAIQQYGSERWNKARIRSRIALAASWAARHHVPILCGEFGVYKKVAPMVDRYRWIDDTRSVLEEFHIGWSMWDFDGGFGLVSYRYPSVQSVPVIDSRCLAALGLRSVAVDAELSPIDDFEHLRSAQLTFPVQWLGGLWTRDAHAGSVSLEPPAAGSNGTATIHIVHTGAHDWAVASQLLLPVHPGQVYELTSAAKVGGPGSCELAVVAYGADGKVVSWSYGQAGPEEKDKWTALSSRFVIPSAVAEIQPRWFGDGPSSVFVNEIRLTRLPGPIVGNLPPTVAAQNAQLSVSVDTATADLIVTDRRTGRIWRQAQGHDSLFVSAVTAGSASVSLSLVNAQNDKPFDAVIKLAHDSPEFTVTISGHGSLARPIAYPRPFVTPRKSHLIIPMNEGVTYRADDRTIVPMSLPAYSGNNLSMSFWGVTDSMQSSAPGYMAILETPDDASLLLERANGLLLLRPEWLSQKGTWGYARTVRYVFYDHGGFVAMCKRYRQYAQKQGIFRTLAEKRTVNPRVDLLAGAADVWYWGCDAIAIAHKLQAAGLKRILWSEQENPSTVSAMNRMDILTGRYDIYQDVMNPATFPHLRGVNPDWPTAAWPADVVIAADGQWKRGWKVAGTDGAWYSCGVLNDELALGFAKRRIPTDLATHRYRARFIDTATASAWNEDFSSSHPLTRTQSRAWRMKLLAYVSGENRLVTGSETGIDAAVPYLDYFEGMISLARYRVTDAGRNVQQILDQVPKQIAKFQLGYRYRIPLWELVYHDCVVSYWYWGDYNNKIPSVWHLRDLFNVLYAQPPEYMFDRSFLDAHLKEFASSYNTIEPTARAAAYAEMTDFRYLTPDRSVQQSTFANGVRVVVNFGTADFALPDGTILHGGDYHSTAH